MISCRDTNYGSWCRCWHPSCCNISPEASFSHGFTWRSIAPSPFVFFVTSTKLSVYFSWAGTRTMEATGRWRERTVRASAAVQRITKTRAKVSRKWNEKKREWRRERNWRMEKGIVVDPDPHSFWLAGSGSGFMRAKITHKSEENSSGVKC